MKMVQRCGAVVLLAAVLLATTALAAPEEESGGAASVSTPVARELQIRTYRNIPYRAKFSARNPAGGEVTFQVERQPKKGTVTVKGEVFTYTPDTNRTGRDSFTYTATDSAGNTSAPAEVTVLIQKARSGVSYADTAECDAAAAAQQLAEDGIFVGQQLGGQYFFEPDRPVTRSEFLAMALETVGRDASEVSITGFCDDKAIPTWAKPYASAALADGVIRGRVTAEGVAFRGEDAITYNEAAAVLNRVLALDDVDLEDWYAGREAVPSWAEQAVGNLEAVQVLQAGSFGSGMLEHPVTRGNMAQMLAAAGTLVNDKPLGLLSWLE